MKRHLTLCGFAMVLSLGTLFVFTTQERSLGQQAGAQSGRIGSSRFADIGLVQDEAGNESDDQVLQFTLDDHALLTQGNLQYRLRDTDTADEREEVLRELRENLISQFDRDMKHRETELEKIQKRVADMEAHLEKRAAAKDDIIELRLQVLVNQAEGLGWADEDRQRPRGLFEGLGSLDRSGFGGMPGMAGRFSGRRSGFGTGRGARTADDAEDYGEFFLRSIEESDENANEEVPDEQPTDSDSDDAEQPRN